MKVSLHANLPEYDTGRFLQLTVDCIQVENRNTFAAVVVQ